MTDCSDDPTWARIDEECGCERCWEELAEDCAAQGMADPRTTRPYSDLIVLVPWRWIGKPCPHGPPEYAPAIIQREATLDEWMPSEHD